MAALAASGPRRRPGEKPNRPAAGYRRKKWRRQRNRRGGEESMALPCEIVWRQCFGRNGNRRKPAKITPPAKIWLSAASAASLNSRVLAAPRAMAARHLARQPAALWQLASYRWLASTSAICSCISVCHQRRRKRWRAWSLFRGAMASPLASRARLSAIGVISAIRGGVSSNGENRRQNRKTRYR